MNGRGPLSLSITDVGYLVAWTAQKPGTPDFHAKALPLYYGLMNIANHIKTSNRLPGPACCLAVSV